MSIQIRLLPETKSTKQLHRSLDRRLHTILHEQVQAAATKHMAALWQHITAATAGGKRTRPLLVHFGYRVAGTVEDDRFVDVGCAFELLHTALVIHDDIIDQDFIRRGKPTLAAHYRDQALAEGKTPSAAEHIGHSVALLAGDALISAALQVLGSACQDTAQSNRIMSLFHEAIQQSAAGELEDVMFSSCTDSASLDEVLRMHRLKTSAYSFEAPLVTGALMAGASEDVVAHLGEFATQLGTSYQIIDDVLGTFGDANVTGKPNDSDLREGKTTVLIALAERIDAAAPTIQAWRQGTVGHEAIRALLVEHDIETQARALADQCAHNARDQLADLALTGEVRTTFDCLIDDLLQRTT